MEKLMEKLMEQQAQKASTMILLPMQASFVVPNR
jgi:hypothetical protein